jgi:hypothetical protein
MMKNLMIIIISALLFVSYLPSKVVFPLSEVNRPVSISLVDDTLLVSDFKTIHLYSLKRGKHIGNVGGIGQGPGEYDEEPVARLLNPNTIFIHELLQGKYMIFENSGKLLEENRIPERFYRIIPVANIFVTAKNNFEGRELSAEFALYDSQFKKINVLLKYNRVDPRIRFDPISFVHSFKVYQKNIYVSKYRKNVYIIYVYDLAGKKINTINKTIKARKIPKEYLNKYLKKFKKMAAWPLLKDKFIFPKIFPAIRDFSVNSNQIIIKTWVEKDNLAEFISLDLKGEMLGRFFLPNVEKLYTFWNGLFYYLVENLDEERWELHAKPIPKFN